MRDVKQEILDIEAKIRRVKDHAEEEISRLRARKQVLQDAEIVLTPAVMEALRKIDFTKET